MTQAERLELLRDQLAEALAERDVLNQTINDLRNKIDALTDYNGGIDNER